MDFNGIKYIICLAIVSLFAANLHAASLLPPLEKDIAPSLATAQSIVIKRFVFSGNTVFSDDELQRIVAPYKNRNLTANDLQQLRVLLSQFYITQGYINSGVRINDQDVSGGELHLVVIEGHVQTLAVRGQKKLQRSYIEDYLRQHAQLEGVLNINMLQEALQLLKHDPRIISIKAELQPTKDAGISLLDVQVEEANPWHISIVGNNYGAPALGSWRSGLHIDTLNLTGYGDSLALDYSLSAGLQDYNLAYQRPLNASRTVLTLQAASNYSTIISNAFKALDIRVQTQSYVLKIQHPLLFNTQHEIAISLAYQQKRTSTSLRGIPFSFDAGSVDGKNLTNILLLDQTWAYHTQTRVLAGTSLLSVGLSKVIPNSADGRFITWLGQAQWVERWSFLNSHSIIGGSVRLSNDRLLASDKFATGGRNSVRGYRESQFNMDNAATFSLEWRIPLFLLAIPILSQKSFDGEVSIATFYDYAKAWDKQIVLNTSSGILSSLGVGVLWQLSSDTQFEIYAAKSLHKVNSYDQYNLQDSGIHMQLSAQVL